MGLRAAIRRRPRLVAFGAGAGLTLLGLAAVGLVVIADQRRAARVVAAGLSRAAGREVAIDRVSDLGTDRVVLHGVRLPRSAGWPAEITTPRVEARGPLLAAAAGERAPLRVTVTRPVIEAGGADGAGTLSLDAARDVLAGLLGGSIALDVAVAGGLLRSPAGGVEFELRLDKGADRARGELTLRSPATPPLVLTADAGLDGAGVRLAVRGRGSLAPVARWLPGSAAGLEAAPLDLAVDMVLAPASATAAGRLAVGSAIAAAGRASVADGTLRATLPRATVDLGLAAGLAGLGWRPGGQAELGDIALVWTGRGALPTADFVIRVPELRLPPGTAGATPVTADGLEARVAMVPVAGGLALTGDASARRVGAAGLDVRPARTRYRLALAPDGALRRVELDDLGVHVEGTTLRGAAGYDAATGRLDARLSGEAGDLTPLISRLRPGWLGPSDRLGLARLRVAVAGLDVPGQRAGTAEVVAGSPTLRRPDGEVAARDVVVRAGLDPGGLTLRIEAADVSAALPALRGAVPAVSGTARLEPGAAGGLGLRQAGLAARAADGRDLVTADLRPRPGASDRLMLSARVPDLGRLGGFWPDVERRLAGSLALDAELAGPDLTAADGRLALRLDEGELTGGGLLARDVVADVPFRRGAAFPGLPPWGRLAAGELLASGVLVRDLVTPARIVHDRLSLNDLAYTLYSGTGRGWIEAELEPAGPFVRGKLDGVRVRIEEFVSTYGIRGGTMTGLLRYDLDVQHRAGRMGVRGTLEVPAGGTVNIELLERLLGYAGADPTGIVRRALESLRTFPYKSAVAEVRTVGDDVRVSVSLRGREFLGIFPARVPEINIRNLPLGFLARQFPGR